MKASLARIPLLLVIALGFLSIAASSPKGVVHFEYVKVESSGVGEGGNATAKPLEMVKIKAKLTLKAKGDQTPHGYPGKTVTLAISWKPAQGPQQEAELKQVTGGDGVAVFSWQLPANARQNSFVHLQATYHPPEYPEIAPSGTRGTALIRVRP